MVGHILPLADDDPMDMLRTAGKVLDKLNYGDTTSIGMRRMYELTGIDHGIAGIQDQLFQSFTNPQGSHVDDGSDLESDEDSDEDSEVGSDEESDDDNFFITRHVVNLNDGQMNSRRIRINTTR